MQAHEADPNERTARNIVTGTWGCAAVVMTGSAWTAFDAYGHLGDNRGLGLATGLAIDVALCVALVGDRRLTTHGVTSRWGRALRTTTLGMSLVFNTGVSVLGGHWFLAFLHSFLPVLLWVLTEYGQDVQLALAQLRTPPSDVPTVAEAPVPDPVPHLNGSGTNGHRPSLDPKYVPWVTPPPPAVEEPRNPPAHGAGTPDLLDRARALREERVAAGLPAGRTVLRELLKVSDREARALVTQLNTAVPGGTR